MGFGLKLLDRFKLLPGLMLRLAKVSAGYLWPIWFYKLYFERIAKVNPYSDDTKFGEYDGTSRYRLGIIKEAMHFHRSYIAACRDMDVSYKVLDISGNNWIDVIENCQCDAFLIWPSALMTTYKQMYDERLWVMVRDMGKIIFPAYDELWMWESKRRMRDWLVAHKVSSPETWIFYDFYEAKEFLKTAQFPLVFKTDHGDSSKGVIILRSKHQAEHIIKKAFSRGLRLAGSHRCDLQWGSVIFQQYVEEAVEWRLIRIGDSYFGYMKKRHGDYASGFGDAVYADPPRGLLDLMRNLTETQNFRSMSIDVLISPDGNNYVTELQSLFGDTVKHRKLMIDGKPGRYIYDQSNDEWVFQEGIFDQNICCNLRVEHVIKMLEERVPEKHFSQDIQEKK